MGTVFNSRFNVRCRLNRSRRRWQNEEMGSGKSIDVSRP
jgi:hypothetical protein